MENKKFFALSDIHSFATPMKLALGQAGFRRTNKDHVLIICGDVFDRGNETLEVYKYLSTLPKDRVILVRGNHEALYFELLKKSFPESHDFHNGTVKTFCQIAGVDPKILDDEYWYKINFNARQEVVTPWEKTRTVWAQIVAAVSLSPITAWLKSKDWVNYFELANYIFVHSFIPTKLQEQYSYLACWPRYQLNSKIYEYMPDWRTANSSAWEDATGGSPGELFKLGLFKPEVAKGKTLVCGHGHAYGVKNILEGTDSTACITYFGDHIIALDACTAVSGFINVFVIKDNICYDGFVKVLK